jgi:hypothetical protein
MQVGMLWYDNDLKRSLAQKVTRAAEHYRAKYGVTPNLCFVNPMQLPRGSEAANGIQVRAERTILPNHFWLGVGDK